MLTFACPAREADARRLTHALARGGALRAYRCVEGSLACVYWPAVVEPLPALPVCGARSAYLACQADLAGAAAGCDAPWHYVVETDVLPSMEVEFNAWYQEEHLQGLAAVPGTVRAARYLNRDGSPRYRACYDLVSAETLGSPPWLAVRATEWSTRVRAAFRNTRRTMFRRLDIPALS